MLLDAQNLSELETYLKIKGWLSPMESIVSAEKPGEGNMNYTLRLRTERRTFIVKQSRPYVEKYPTIAAPVERAVTEGSFYQKIQTSTKLQGFMPQLLGMDVENSILVLEDLGISNDYTYLYKPNETITEAEIAQLMTYASALHNGFSGESGPQFANRAMRALNHEHIFLYPLMQENGFNLDVVQAGLQALAMPYKQNEALKIKAKVLGEVYLADGKHLLHGDFYPGSFLKTDTGIKVIDPEFCFYGPAEFDLGVLIAHLKMARQSHEIIQAMRQHYQAPPHFDETLMNQFVGIEIIRRLIGLAQLPLSLSLTEKALLLEEAQQLV